ncbi:hypothetical protein WI42_11930 [Burkholderia ubonensis]|nr:hypothetical protein WI37_15900 [Burkholderia ubonensis]KVA21220.1 hypothetical protein WI42_11930 [Burkholderia ubonensis]
MLDTQELCACNNIALHPAHVLDELGISSSHVIACAHPHSNKRGDDKDHSCDRAAAKENVAPAPKVLSCSPWSTLIAQRKLLGCGWPNLEIHD